MLVFFLVRYCTLTEYLFRINYMKHSFFSFVFSPNHSDISTTRPLNSILFTHIHLSRITITSPTFLSLSLPHSLYLSYRLTFPVLKYIQAISVYSFIILSSIKAKYISYILFSFFVFLVFPLIHINIFISDTLMHSQFWFVYNCKPHHCLIKYTF